jgi:hypothetical protein
MLTEAEIELRLPIWHAFSDLFLDTELQPHDYERIAASLRSSAFEPAELRAILEQEVAPAFVFNLLDVAGEWSRWTEEEVRDIMLRSLYSGGGGPPVPWLKRRLYRRHIAEEWAKIEPLLGVG